MIKNSKRNLLFSILYNLTVIVLFLLIVEVIIGFYLRNPKKIPEKLIAVFREYYMLKDRKVIQAIPEYSRYDSMLCYTLKPGQFTFKNREFSNLFNVNSLGMRDDEKSAYYPEIICCGDSYTMAWGVEQNESFSQIIEKRLNKKVLNSGISSYGTVRELLALKRIRTDSLKYLIIQYADNDYVENHDFIQNNFSLKVTNEADYKNLCKWHKQTQKYFLFKHVIYFPKIIAKWLIGKPVGNFDAEKPDKNLSEQYAFLQIISHFENLSSDAEIIIFNIDYRKCKPDFITLLKQELQNFKTLNNRIILIDFSKHLTDKYFYRLDDHMTTEGHILVAETIIRKLKTDIYYENNK